MQWLPARNHGSMDRRATHGIPSHLDDLAVTCPAAAISTSVVRRLIHSPYVHLPVVDLVRHNSQSNASTSKLRPKCSYDRNT